MVPVLDQVKSIAYYFATDYGTWVLEVVGMFLW